MFCKTRHVKKKEGFHYRPSQTLRKGTDNCANIEVAGGTLIYCYAMQNNIDKFDILLHLILKERKFSVIRKISRILGAGITLETIPA